MKTYAITGGIGSGKSTLKHWFEKQGVPTLNADEIARDLVQPGMPALQQIALTFGDAFIKDDGHLNREAMRQKVFHNDESRQQLEAILHPMIRQTTAEQLAKFEAEGNQMAVVEIPLLVETGRPDYIDKVIVSDCSPSLQIERVQQRNNWAYEEIANIMKRQVSRQERLNHADIVIDTSRDLASIEAQLQHYFSGL
ncbi:dephospho-CoA kinase [Hydrogenovibrio sp. JE_KL2]|uniref:dephospho-CoA kinase n=1 Tax=Hydrogenovibrio sp. JE_KL2 TaxID=2651188 RepID=UPI00128BFBDA|nr:dephospho-CoA kinase [Hydrogenovibrio sp. JE_KL2]MPQ75595.1 dephospho-CoA kinase [Hydrogenovibrio sp. JE_KL2]